MPQGVSGWTQVPPKCLNQISIQIYSRIIHQVIHHLSIFKSFKSYNTWHICHHIAACRHVSNRITGSPVESWSNHRTIPLPSAWLGIHRLLHSGLEKSVDCHGRPVLLKKNKKNINYMSRTFNMIILM